MPPPRNTSTHNNKEPMKHPNRELLVAATVAGASLRWQLMKDEL